MNDIFLFRRQKRQDLRELTRNVYDYREFCDKYFKSTSIQKINNLERVYQKHVNKLRKLYDNAWSKFILFEQKMKRDEETMFKSDLTLEQDLFYLDKYNFNREKMSTFKTFVKNYNQIMSKDRFEMLVKMLNEPLIKQDLETQEAILFQINKLV